MKIWMDGISNIFTITYILSVYKWQLGNLNNKEVQSISAPDPKTSVAYSFIRVYTKTCNLKTIHNKFYPNKTLNTLKNTKTSTTLHLYVDFDTNIIKNNHWKTSWTKNFTKQN